MPAFVAKLVVDPRRCTEFEAMQTELRELVHKHEPNAPVYELIKSRDADNTYLCIATFTDQEAFDHHMSVDFHDRLAPKILECLSDEMEIGFYDVVGAPHRARP